MSTRKFTATRIFDGYRFEAEKVVVTDHNGTVLDLVPLSDAGEGIEFVGDILSPGLINCHCHLELSHMKGLIPEKTGLVDFVLKVVTERHHSREEILYAIEKAENEMLQNGIVAVGDICNNELTIPQKKKSRLTYYNFIEASGWLPAASQTRFERAHKLLNEFSKSGQPCSIVPHAPYSVSAGLWEAIQPFFEDKVVTIHNQETKHEDEFFLEGTGDFKRMYQLMNIDNSHHQPTKLSSLRSYIDELNEAVNAILVHNTFINQTDLDWIHSPGTGHQPNPFFCLCVNANLYIENVFPPVAMLRENDCAIVLGTDSLASNWSLNILGEIKTIQKKLPLIPLEEMLRWATINGARALQMESSLGSFEKGKKPGIVSINDELVPQRIL